MDVSFIGIFIFIIIVLVIYKVTKQVAKTLFLASAVLVVLFIFFGFSLLSDVKDFRENFSSQDSLYLLEDDGNVLAALSGNFAEESEPVLLSDSKLEIIHESFVLNDLDSVKGENYKLFVIPLSSFDGVELSDFDGQEVFSLLRSDSPVDDYVVSQIPDGSETQKQLARRSVLDQSNVFDDSGFKAVLFGMLLSQSLEDEGSAFLFQGFKEGSVIIFPETSLFKLLSWVPSSLFESMVGV